MPFNITVGGVVRFRTYYTYPGQVATNSREWQCTNITGASTFPSPTVLLRLDNDFSAVVKNCMTADATYYGSQLYFLTPPASPPRPDNNTVNQGPGSDLGEALPLQTSGLISLYSETLGKAGQGRIYIPFPSIDSQGTDSTPDGLYMIDLDNVATDLTTPKVIVSGIVTSTWVPVLYVPGGPPPKTITKYIARDGWATQRRRGNFGRPNPNPF